MQENVLTYYGNYMPVGDILVVATCVIFLILLKVAYSRNDKPLRLFRFILFELLATAHLKLLYNTLLRRLLIGTIQNGALVMFLHSAYHALIYVVLCSLILYLQLPFKVESKVRRRHACFLGISTFGFSVLSFAEFFTDLGLNLRSTENGYVVVRGFDTFPIGFCYLGFFVVFTIYYYRDRLYKQIVRVLYMMLAFTVGILLMQLLFDQTSYTLCVFLFPLYAIFYLLHSSPYDIELGFAGRDSFEKDFSVGNINLWVEVYLHDVEKGRMQCTTSLLKALKKYMQNLYPVVRMYRLTAGCIVFGAVGTFTDVDWEQFAGDLRVLITEHYSNYRCLIIPKKAFNLRGSDMMPFMQFIGRKMPAGSWRVITSEDVVGFSRRQQLIQYMKEIVADGDLNDGRVLVYCQPVWNIQENRYDTGEALMRLSFNGEVVQPYEFIELAEKTGAIYFLGQVLLNKTCKAIHKLVADGYELKRISVNFSIYDFRERGFCDDVLGIIKEAGIDYDKIAIEMTETQNETDFLTVKEKMQSLRSVGMKFYLDDFGTGYSNYERIMELPFDVVKFDRSLVQASAESDTSVLMMSSMAKMFSGMNYILLYEGVENDLDVERCAKMHAEYLQGYHYSKPVPIEKLSDFFEKSGGDA